MRHFLGVALICLMFPFKVLSVQNKVLDVGLMDQGRPPYFTLPTETALATGLYIDILDEIGREVGVKFRYRFLPQARIRHLMNHYRIDVEPGIAKEWRTEEIELKQSVYSTTILTSSEVAVYNPKNIKIPVTKDVLASLTPCSILGFFDLDLSKDKLKDQHIKPQQVLTEIQLLQMIKNKRCDFAVFPKDVVKPHLSRLGLMATDSVAVFDLKIRFTEQYSELLPQVNNAIETMLYNGKIEEIISKYRGVRD
ncbi:substrate-binding periplasmic protein [Moritella dasanensis]|uniref:substrate-binding periplasmic protein n=1 Tax=Moritella dasanensis TaxID=428031 RepID=UPI0002E41DCD|nr:ABC transporter substrate-binding protein [Moritella dasanensis]